jgi:ribosomal-protein-serine acetyltransferase
VFAADRVVIRPYRADHARAVWAAIEESRDSLAMWIPDIARRQTVSEVRAALHNLEKARRRNRSALFAIWRQGDETFLGEVGLHDLDFAARSATVGYWLRPSARGYGFMDDALRLIHQYAAVELGLGTLQAHIALENVASRRIAERNDYVLTSTRPADPEWDGNASRMLIYTRRLVPNTPV